MVREPLEGENKDMSESESLKTTFKRLEQQQKIEEDAEACFCEFAEKMQGRYFTVTRKCRLDGCSCANFNNAKLVNTCPIKRRKE